MIHMTYKIYSTNTSIMYIFTTTNTFFGAMRRSTVTFDYMNKNATRNI